MSLARILAGAVLAVPLAATAQTSYSRAWIEREPVYIRDDMRVCFQGTTALNNRMAAYEEDKRDAEREGLAIEREGRWLADDLRRLDNRDAAKVAAYNARSADHNARVAAHNRRIADLNGLSNLLNADAADLSAYCRTR